MKINTGTLFSILILSIGLYTPAQAATINLAADGFGFNIDSTTTYPGDPIPSEMNVSGFNFITGLGNISVTITGAGIHNFDAFFDHEIDQAINTFFNETASTTGVASAGQSWEIDEPGYYDGDIYENFQVSLLDNGIGTSIWGDTAFPEDVSMAMGWDFTLASGETALINMVLSEVMPTGGFFLTHSDPDSNTAIYLSSDLSITAVPLPGALWLLLSGVIGFGFIGRRKV